MRVMLRYAAVLLVLAMVPVPAHAQEADAQTLADVRAELNALYAEIQDLRNLFVTSGAAAGVENAAPALQRLDSVELELQRVTGELERLENRVQRVVDDGTRRVGDLEFRLTELEGGDISALGDTPQLGANGTAVEIVTDTVVATPVAPSEGSGDTPQLAATEQVDFDAAYSDFASGNFASAADKFAAFVASYPGGPLSGDAQFYRAEALASQGDWAQAARSYLDSFSGAPQGPHAPVALYKLGIALSALGQIEESCLTLNEVMSRYPGADQQLLQDAMAKKQELGCL